jgi:membrane associated rhomboid family serine protease
MGGIPEVVKNLLIINVIIYLATTVFYRDLFDVLSMHFILSDRFQPFQIVSHMFMHSQHGLAHIFFNMFALWMFGSPLERIWGPKRFLVFYLVAGFGAIFLFMLINYVEFQALAAKLSPAQVQDIMNGGSSLLPGNNPKTAQRLYQIYNTPIVGASGAIYGLLIAFGMLFPNTPLMLIFLPIPIKAKYFIPILMVIELFLGVSNFAWNNIAHFAHLGGALFGFILVTIWKRNRNEFY